MYSAYNIYIYIYIYIYVLHTQMYIIYIYIYIERETHICTYTHIISLGVPMSLVSLAESHRSEPEIPRSLDLNRQQGIISQS